MPITLAWEGTIVSMNIVAEKFSPDGPWDLLCPTEPPHRFSRAKNGRNVGMGGQGSAPSSCDFMGHEPGDVSQASQPSSQPRMTPAPPRACCAIIFPPQMGRIHSLARATVQQQLLTLRFSSASRLDPVLSLGATEVSRTLLPPLLLLH